MIQRSILPVLALSLASVINAQTDRQSYGGIGLHYGESFTGSAGDRFSGMLGWNGHIAFPINDMPFDWGFGFDNELLDAERRSITVRFPDFQTYQGTLVVRNMAVGVLPFLRYRPFDVGVFMPYAEVFAGGRLFTTRSQIELDYDQTMSKRSAHSDIASAWGVATGVMVRVKDEVFLHLRYAHSWGGLATLPDLETVRMNAGRTPVFDTRTADTGAWRLQVGLVGYF